MTTMREERIKCILCELSNRVASMNSTMRELKDDFYECRKPFMQIRKKAMRTIMDADATMCRFIAIASANHVNEDYAVYQTFHCRRRVFNELELFFH